MAFFGKKFKRVRDENVDKLVAATQDTGISVVVNSVVWFTDNGNGSYTFNMEGDFGKFEHKFKNGEEVDQPSRGGVPQTVKYTVTGNTITQLSNKEGKTTTYIREFDGNNLKMTIKKSDSDITAVVYAEAI